MKINYNSETDTWDKLEDRSPNGMYIDGYLKSNLDIFRKKIKEDRDFWITIDGTEGSGKSVLAMQIAQVLDPTFNIDRIAFNGRMFKKICLAANKFQCIVFDEAMRGLNSSRAMSEVNQSLKEMAAEIRQRNLFIIIVIPTFFELQRYIAIWRTKGLIHVYEGKEMERGYFMYFDSVAKKIIYLIGRKTYNYNIKNVHPSFFGRFLDYYTVDEIKYRELKAKYLEDEPFKEQIKGIKYKIQRNNLIRWMFTQFKIKVSELSHVTGLCENAIRLIVNENLEKSDEISKENEV